METKLNKPELFVFGEYGAAFKELEEGLSGACRLIRLQRVVPVFPDRTAGIQEIDWARVAQGRVALDLARHLIPEDPVESWWHEIRLLPGNEAAAWEPCDEKKDRQLVEFLLRSTRHQINDFQKALGSEFRLIRVSQETDAEINNLIDFALSLKGY
ncbi:MAG: hypothetical protein EBR02_10155 [Alphaproteobacteria bacterium]|nr:hypothetical protein [Alphaproteobacteria bacterium]